jgi:hypothetical protein
MLTLTGCAATRDATERRAVIDQNRFRRVHAGDRWPGCDGWQGVIPDRGAIMGICGSRIFGVGKYFHSKSTRPFLITKKVGSNPTQVGRTILQAARN